MQEAGRAEAEHREQAVATLQQELEGARTAHAVLACEAQHREGELVGRLAALQQECGALLAVVERAEEQHAEVEQRLLSQLGLLARRVEEQGDEDAARLPALSAALSHMQASAEGLEVRLLRLEAQAAVAMQDRQVAATGQWATLVRSRRYRTAVKQLRDGLQAQLLESQETGQQQAVQLRRLQAALEAARGECASLAARLQDMQLQHQQEMNELAGAQQEELARLRQQAQQELLEAAQQADDVAAAAVAAAEQQCRVELAARWVAPNPSIVGDSCWATPAPTPLRMHAWCLLPATLTGALPCPSPFPLLSILPAGWAKWSSGPCKTWRLRLSSAGVWRGRWRQYSLSSGGTRR